MMLRIYRTLLLAVVSLFMSATCLSKIEATDGGKDTYPVIPAADTVVRCDGISLEIVQRLGGYVPELYFGEKKINFLDSAFPIILEVDGKEIKAKYDSLVVSPDGKECIGTVCAEGGSKFFVRDVYQEISDWNFRLTRDVRVLEKGSDGRFNSIVGINTGKSASFQTNEYFVPGKWYRQNFLGKTTLPGLVPFSDDNDIMYRAEYTTLPMVFCRYPETGLTVSLTHTDLLATTVMADSKNVSVNPDYQYSSVGVRKKSGTLAMQIVYPGNEYETRGGKGVRSHPVDPSVSHSYTIEFGAAYTDSYGQAVDKFWMRGFDIYNPQVVKADLASVYEAEIETMKYYYQSSVRYGGDCDEPGIPFTVNLTPPYEVRGLAYQIGFTGMAVTCGYALFRYGLEHSDKEWVDKGADILDFWAERGQTELGFPMSQYRPSTSGDSGKWVEKSNMRTISDGMEALVSAYRYAKNAGYDYPQWLDACLRFASWLNSNQNSDGSWYFSYDHRKIVDGRHPVTNYSKYMTGCLVKFLAELYLVTNDNSVKSTLDKASDFFWKEIHSEYAYMDCVPSANDGKGTIDKESAQNALYSSLVMYDLTKDKRWIDAAQQAAINTATWAYMYNLPVENDNPGPFIVSPDVSSVGQSKCSVGPNSGGLGNAWNSFQFYRLYLFTGRQQYLTLARIWAMNTVQTMNLSGTIYPGGKPGLQIEAYHICIPRRNEATLTTTAWEYICHLDPMLRFADCFGTYDMSQLEFMPIEKQQELNETYVNKLKINK